MKTAVFFLLFSLLLTVPRIPAGQVRPVRDTGKIRAALNSRVSLLWNKTESAEAFKILSKLAGCTVTVSPAAFPPERFREMTFTLRLNRVPLRRVLDMCGATLGLSYWIDRDFGIWFGTETELFRDKKKIHRFYNTEGLERRGDTTLTADIREFFKLPLLSCKNAFIRRPGKTPGTIAALLPVNAHPRLRRLLKLMSRSSSRQDHASAAPGPGTLPEELGSKQIRLPEQRTDMGAFCAALAEQTGVSVNCNTEQLGNILLEIDSLQ